MEKKLKNVVTVRVKTDLEKPMDVNILAEAIKSVADNFDKALHSGLTKRAICVLIKDMMPAKEMIGIGDIGNVLTYAMNLRKHLTK